MTTYTTIQGDMWDSIAYREMGSSDYTGQLMMANATYSGYFTFPAGIVLNIPDVDESESTDDLPPWKQVSS